MIVWVAPADEDADEDALDDADALAEAPLADAEALADAELVPDPLEHPAKPANAASAAAPEPSFTN